MSVKRFIWDEDEGGWCTPDNSDTFSPNEELVRYSDYRALLAERDALRKAIDEHNAGCRMACGEGDQEGVRCKYRPYFPRHCPDCPLYDIIEIAQPEAKPSQS